MSAFPSSYIRDKVLDKVVNNTDFTPPTSLYLALFTSDPTVAGTGDEVSGGSYARQSVSFNASSSGTVDNDGAVSFTGLPAATITHYGVFDASTSGNLIFFGELPAAISANSGDEVNIADGGIDLTFTGS